MEYKRADQFIMHDYSGGIRSDIDQFEICKHLDVSGVNIYSNRQDDLTGMAIALSGDFHRSMKNDNYFAELSVKWLNSF